MTVSIQKVTVYFMFTCSFTSKPSISLIHIYICFILIGGHPFMTSIDFNRAKVCVSFGPYEGRTYALDMEGSSLGGHMRMGSWSAPCGRPLKKLEVTDVNLSSWRFLQEFRLWTKKRGFSAI